MISNVDINIVHVVANVQSSYSTIIKVNTDISNVASNHSFP